MRCALLVVAFAFALSTATARAQPPSDWNNTSGGSFSLATNWTPNGAPGAAGYARFNLPNTYAVTFAGGVSNSKFSVNQGNVTFALGGFTYAQTGIPNDIGIGSSPATLTVQNGTVNNDGLGIGAITGATGTLIVDTAATFNMGSSSLSVGGGGSGTLVVQNGASLTSGQSSFGNVVGGFGQGTITGTNSKWTLNDFMRIGDAGSGTLTVSAAGQVTGGSLTVGAQAGGSGNLTVTGVNSTMTMTNAFVGLAGSGTVGILAGGKVTAQTLTVGEFLGSVGSIVVTDTSSTLTVSGTTIIGGIDPNQPASSANVTVSSGGTVNFNGSTTLQPTAIVNIKGGTLSLNTLSEATGAQLNWTSGTVQFANGSTVTAPLLNQLLAGSNTIAAGQTLAATAGTLALGGPLLVAGNGAINGSAITTSGSLTINTLGTVSATDTVSLGTGTVTQVGDLATLAATNGVTNNGTLQLNGLAATVKGFLANLGTLQGTGKLTAGLSNGTTGTIRARSGDYLVVAGITGSTNLGNIELSGGTLEFTAALSNLANGFISGRGEFRGGTANPGGFGLSNSGVMAFSGGTTDIRGDVQNNSGAHIVNAGGGVVTFYDDVIHNGAEIRTNAGSRTVFFGSQSGAGPFTGTGTVEYNGDLRPGNSPARVTYEGDVILNGSAKYFAEIGGTTPGAEYDELTIQGTVNLSGVLQVLLINNFVPQPGQSFDLIENRGVSPIVGTFTGIPEGQLFTVSGVTFQATYLGGGSGHDFVISVPVPEPGTLALCGFAAVGWVTFWRRRWRAD
jgi:T5SS/PEP-CTERM-associated repeat protein